MSLAREMQVSVEEINEKLLPLMDLAEVKRILAAKGENFLEIRFELLVAYTICILFYLSLKAKGRVTNNHPVLDRLTKYKSYLERMEVSSATFEKAASEIIKE